MPNDTGAPAAPTEATANALTVQQRASLALGAPEHEKKLVDLAKQATEIVAIKDKVSYDQVHGTRMALKRARLAIEQTGKTAREDAQAFAKAVIAEQNRLIAIIDPEETRLQELQTAWDAEVERKKREAARAEAERVAEIQAGIRAIRGVIIDVAGRSSTDIEAAIRNLVAEEITRETAQEFLEEAETTREQTLAKLREMLEAQKRAEAEAAQIKAERAELERRQAEQAERERVHRERVEAEQRRTAEAEAERLRAIKAEEDAARERIAVQECETRQRAYEEDKRLAAERERIAGEARALEERQRAEREAIEAKARAEREAVETRERDERLALEQRDREEREARELAARQERERVEEDERQRLRVELERTDIREALKRLRDRVNGVDEFAWFATAFDRHHAPKTARTKKAA